MYCENCGAEIKESNQFCEMCGNKILRTGSKTGEVNAGVAFAQNKDKKGNKRPFVLVVIAAAVFLLGGLFGSMYRAILEEHLIKISL